MTVLDYAMMVEDSHVETKLVEYRAHGPDSRITGRGTGDLLAVALTDVLSDGLSMVYSFYDPEHRTRISPIRSALSSRMRRMLREGRNSSATTRTETQARHASQAGR